MLIVAKTDGIYTHNGDYATIGRIFQVPARNKPLFRKNMEEMRLAHALTVPAPHGSALIYRNKKEHEGLPVNVGARVRVVRGYILQSGHHRLTTLSPSPYHVITVALPRYHRRPPALSPSPSSVITVALQRYHRRLTTNGANEHEYFNRNDCLVRFIGLKVYTGLV